MTIRRFKTMERLAISFQLGAQRCRETLALPSTPANIKWAEATLNEIRGKIVRGTFVYGDYFPKSKRAKKSDSKGTVKVWALLDAFLKDMEDAVAKGNLAPSTLDGYRKAIDGHLKPSFGKLAIQDLAPAEIRSWVKSAGLTGKSIRNILIPLRAVVADAVNDDAIARNPFASVELDRLLAKHATKSTYEVDPFTPSEVAAIVGAASGQAQNFLRFAFATGLRTSELIALRWADVDLDKRVVHVRRAKVLKLEKGPKTRAGNRFVTLDDEAVRALHDQRQWTQLVGRLVFHHPATNKPLIDDQPVREGIWKPAVEKAGVRYRNPYQTRHTFASTHLSRGANPWWVAAQMGHEDVDMVFETYGKFIPEAHERPRRHAHP